MSRPWTCPFCNRDAVFRDGDEQFGSIGFRHPLTKSSLNEQRALVAHLEFCPNPECKKTGLTVQLWTRNRTSPQRDWQLSEILQEWKLLPESRAKEFPDYIPAPILADYREACRIASLSPKASATLARRCLQGMIRDFWKITESRLKDEVDALKDKIDPETWDAIDSVRKIGNIGAHMEADINVIVDVDPGEADLLVDLIETLFSDWYVARSNKQKRLARIKNAAEQKQRTRQGKLTALKNDAPPPPS